MIATEHLNSLPSRLLEQLKTLLNHQENASLAQMQLALTLAKEIAQTLEFKTQIWLVHYLQQWYWNNALQGTSPLTIRSRLEQLESTRQLLLNYVQPRLVWEVMFLNIIKRARG